MRKLLLCSLLLIPLTAFAQKTPPADKELKPLVLESLLAFNKSIQEKDFTSFHGYISALWRKEITPQRLATIFKPFTEQEVDLTPITKLDPTFSPPPKIEDGLLVVQGRYPTQPSRVEFRLKYVYEKTAWKLAGIKVDVAPTGPSDVELPSEKEARALVLDSLLAFNRAVQTKSFVDFHKQKIASVWRAQITAGKLLDIFEAFVEQEADIAGIAKSEPKFEKPIALNEDGVLELTGFYPTEPHRVRFTLGYLYEEPEWKLVQVNVNIRPDTEAESETDDDESE